MVKQKWKNFKIKVNGKEFSVYILRDKFRGLTNIDIWFVSIYSDNKLYRHFEIYEGSSHKAILNFTKMLLENDYPIGRYIWIKK